MIVKESDPIKESLKRKSQSHGEQPSQSMESDFDDTILNKEINDILDESPESSNDDGAARGTSNLGLEIVSTFSCTDSGVDELINSPVKNSKLNIMTKDDSATISEDIDTDTVESNLIEKIEQPERLVTSTKDLQGKTFPQKSYTEVVSSVKDTIETVENIAGIENGDEEPRKPGPRSKTRLLEPPAVRNSPTKVNQESDKLEMIEKTKGSLGNADTNINREKIILAEIVIEEVNHDGMSQRQRNKVDWLDTDDCSNKEVIREVEDCKPNKIAGHKSESEED